MLSLRRETLSRWKKQPLFVAECARCCAERHEYARIRFHDVFDSLVKRLISGMAWGEDSTTIAIALLKYFGPSASMRQAGMLPMMPTALPAPASALPLPSACAEASAALS